MSDPSDRRAVDRAARHATDLAEPQPPSCNRCRHFSSPAGTPICGLMCDLVYGTPLQMTCYAARADMTRCRPDGRYFEAKA